MVETRSSVTCCRVVHKEQCSIKKMKRGIETMKRTDFIKIIRLRSRWKVDKRRGNYELPNGNKLTTYIKHLVETQMEIDTLLIRENGDLCNGFGGEWNTETKMFDDYTLMPPFEDNEKCSIDEMERRINKLVYEIVQ